MPMQSWIQDVGELMQANLPPRLYFWGVCCPRSLSMQIWLVPNTKIFASYISINISSSSSSSNDNNPDDNALTVTFSKAILERIVRWSVNVTDIALVHLRIVSMNALNAVTTLKANIVNNACLTS